MDIRALGLDDLPDAQRLLRTNAPANLFLLGLVESALSPQPERGCLLVGLWRVATAAASRWPGFLQRPRLHAFCAVSYGGLVVPFAPEAPDAAALAGWVRERFATALYVGPREAVDTFWTALEDPRAVRLRYDQRLYVCDEVSEGPVPRGLRLAVPGDAETVGRFASQMMLEDLGFDPAAVDAEHHRRQVRARIDRGATWVVEGADRLVFKVDIGSRCEDGVTLGGTFVPHDARGQGICAAAMRGVCLDLLRTYPRVALHVNEANLPAVRAYERAGFTRADPFRILMV